MLLGPLHMDTAFFLYRDTGTKKYGTHTKINKTSQTFFPSSTNEKKRLFTAPNKEKTKEEKKKIEEKIDALGVTF